MVVDLQVKSISASYEAGRNILQEVTFSLHSGQMMVIHGHNGSGKSTLFRVLAGLLPLQAGEIHWRGERIQEVLFGGPIYPWVGLMLQTDNIFPSLTVEENIALAMVRGGKKEGGVCKDFLPILKTYWRKRAGLLSGGERKLLGLALAMAIEVPLLLLDEPIAGLSPSNVELVQNILTRRKQEGAVIIIVEHSIKSLQENLIDAKGEMREGVLTIEGHHPNRKNEP